MRTWIFQERPIDAARQNRKFANTAGIEVQYGDCQAAHSSALPVPPDDIEKFLAIEPEFLFPDPVYTCHLLKRWRLAARHVEQAAVGQDHIGRDVLRLGERRAVRAQRLEQGLVGAALAAERCRGCGFARGLLARRRDGVPAQFDFRLALEHSPAGRRNRPAAVACDVERQDAGSVKLAENRTPFVAAVLLADPEGGQPVMAEVSDRLGILAEEEADEMLGAEPLAGSQDRRHCLLGRDGAVDHGDAAGTDVAIAAGRCSRLAEIAEQGLASATRGLAERYQGIEAQPVDPF